MDDEKYKKIEALLVHTAALTSLCYTMLASQLGWSEQDIKEQLEKSTQAHKKAINGENENG